MKEQAKLKRGISPKELEAMAIPTIKFAGEWHDAFGTPETTGVWFIWGESGSGKTSFTTQLSKKLTDFGRVAVNSLEEGPSLAMKNLWKLHNMGAVTGKVILLQESIDELCVRLDKRKAPRIVIIDSVQYTGLRIKQFHDLVARYKGKVLFIFVSQADGTEPRGSLAKSIMFDASLKIYVEGYRAFSKGRSIGPKGYYTVWPKAAADYWGDGLQHNETEQ